MKIRRVFVVVGLVAALLGSSAAPAQAIYSQARAWQFFHYAETLMYVQFVLATGYTPYDGWARAADPLEECSQNRKVKLQIKTSSGWNTLAQKETNDKAKFKASVKDKPGKYRAFVPKVEASETESGYECYESVTEKRHTH